MKKGMSSWDTGHEFPRSAVYENNHQETPWYKVDRTREHDSPGFLIMVRSKRDKPWLVINYK